MSLRLWSDLSPSAGRRFWSGLTSSPGFITPAPAVLSLQGLSPAAAQPTTVFRSPATLVVFVNGKAVVSELRLVPQVAQLGALGQATGSHTTRVITPAVLVDYQDVPGLAPTIIYVQTITPARAVVSLQSVELNLSQGGNIGFLTPQTAQIAAVGYQPNFVFHATGAAALTINGLAPSVVQSMTILPDPGYLLLPLLPPTVDKSFTWVDVDPSPPLVWTRQDNVVS